MRRVIVIAVLLTLAGCGTEGARTPQKPTVALGEGRLAVPGGHIWYRVSGTGTGMPLVLLHGGPGFSSYYLKPFEGLGDERIVVRYDQLGGGKSDTTTDTTLFTVAHFVDELDSLRAHLGIPRWHVLGHSWGTIIALEYYRVHPDRVASLTFGSPVFDLPAYARQAQQLVATLSDSSKRAVKRALATGKFDAPAYERAIDEFYALYVFRHPVKADLDSTFATVNEHIYRYMQGPSEFTITGTLKDYDATPFLAQIQVPVLVTVGEFDEVGPELVRKHAAMIPGARFELLAGSAHITPWDASEANLRVARDFLRAADSTGLSRQP